MPKTEDRFGNFIEPGIFLSGNWQERRAVQGHGSHDESLTHDHMEVC